MYTQCPVCKTRRNISVDQLKKSHANVRCRRCSLEYDALELLTEDIPEKISVKNKPSQRSTKKRKSSKIKSQNAVSQKNKSPKDAPLKDTSSGIADELFPWESRPAAKLTFRWDLGFYAACILLIGQIYFFEGYRLSQNAKLRPWLTKTCYLINCSLPVYKNLAELSVISGTLQAASNNTLNFQAAFTNDADFPQAYPDLKLTFLKFNGDPFAERIFKPVDYSPDRPYYKKISAGEMVEINFSIATPEDKIGGYTFELI